MDEDDSSAQSIVEEKFFFEKHVQPNNSHNSSKPLQNAAVFVIRAMNTPTKQGLINLMDRAGALLEQSMVYYHFKQRASQNFLVSFYKLCLFLQ